tara:strand:- start:3042 stop:3305 length:264 start_codon:yes stop_codon:yes gene_type:complete
MKKNKYIADLSLTKRSCGTKTIETFSYSMEDAEAYVSKIIKEDYYESEVISVTIHEIVNSHRMNLSEVFIENVECEYADRFKWDERD